MLLKDKKVKTKWNGRLRKYYEQFGYIFTGRNDDLYVYPKHLKENSDVLVFVVCDYCGKEYQIQYKDYIKCVVKGKIKKCCCDDCKKEKIKESNLKYYGVINPMAIPEIHKKQEDSKRRNISIVRQKFIDMNFTPLFDDEDYKNGHNKLKCYCNKHKDIIQYKTYYGLEDNDGCKYCRDEHNSGENHWNWQGGLSELSKYLRNKTKTWKNDSKEKSNKCYITEKIANTYHHLYPFQKIVDETMQQLNMEYKGQISNYTEEELKLIKNEFLKVHNSYGLGICLTEEIHNLFHYIYGFENVSMEFLQEFKERYNNGEFDNINLKDYKYHKKY